MSAIRGNKAEIAFQDNLIREKVRGRMIARGITQEIMAHRMGVSLRTFQRMMAEPSKMSLAECRKLAAEMSWGYEKAGEVLFG